MASPGRFYYQKAYISILLSTINGMDAYIKIVETNISILLSTINGKQERKVIHVHLNFNSTKYD